MKSTELTKRLKELLGCTTNDEILAGIERMRAAMQERQRPRQEPFGILVMIDPERPLDGWWVRPFGIPENKELACYKVLKHVCERFIAMGLDPAIEESMREQIRAELEAEISAAQIQENDNGGEGGEDQQLRQT